METEGLGEVAPRSADELAAIIRATIAAVKPVGTFIGGISLHYPTEQAVTAALATPGARFVPIRDTGTGYVRLVVDGITVAIHEVTSERAAAAGLVPPMPGPQPGVRRRRRTLTPI